MEIINIDINQLNPAEYNPRILTDEQKDNIKSSLNEFGFVNPLVVRQLNSLDYILLDLIG